MTDVELTDMISGNITISTNDTLPMANITLANDNGKYNNTLNYGEIIDIRAGFSNLDSDSFELVTNLTHYYNFDDYATTSVLTDSEGNGNGTISGATYTTDHSISGYSLFFDGVNDTVTLPNLNLNSEDSFSINLNAKAFDGGYYYYHTVYTMGTATLWIRESDGTSVDWYQSGSYMIVLDAGVSSTSSTEYVYISSSNDIEKIYLNSSDVLTVEWSETIFGASDYGRAGKLFGTSNEYLIVGSNDGDLSLIEVSTGLILWTDTTEHTAAIYDITTDGQNNIYTACADGEVRSFNISGGLRWSADDHTGVVYSIDIDSFGNVYTAGFDGNVNKYSNAGALISTFDAGDTCFYLAIDSDDNLYLSFEDSSATATFAKYSTDFELLVEYGSVYAPGKISIANDNTVYTSGRYIVIRRFDSNLVLLDSYSSMDNQNDVVASTTITNTPAKQMVFKRGNNYPLIGLSGRDTIEFQLNNTTTITHTMTESNFMTNFVNIGVSYDNTVFSLYVNGELVSRELCSLESGNLTAKLGETQGSYSYFYGNIDNLAIWSGRSLTAEEQFNVWNNNDILERADFAEVERNVFRGKIEDVDYQFDNSSGFTVSVNAKAFPELTDTSFTEIIVNEYANTAIDKILEHYRSYGSIVFTFWDENGWVSTSYNSTTGVSSWSRTPKSFPTYIDDLIVISFQDERGWKAIKEVCARVNLDVWLEYDDLNDVWSIRTVNKDSYSLYPKEVAQWRMNDVSFNINKDSQVLVKLNNDYVDRSVYNYIFTYDLGDLPTDVKTTMTTFATSLFGGGSTPTKVLGSAGTTVDTLSTYGIAYDSHIDMTGSIYIASGSRLIKQSFDVIEDILTTTGSNDSWQIIGSVYSVVAEKDGSSVYSASAGSPFTLRNHTRNGVLSWSSTPHTDLIRCIATDNNGYIYTASNDNTVKKISIYNASVAWTFSGFTDDVSGVTVDSSGYVYACAINGVVKRITSLGVEDWTHTISPAVNSYDIVLDSSNNVFVASSGGYLTKLSSTGTHSFTTSIYSSSINISLDVDSADNIYIMKFDNILVKTNNSGTVQWNKTLSFSGAGYTVSVDKRTHKNIIAYNPVTDEEYSLELEDIESPLAGKVYVNIPFLDAKYDNYIVFEIEDSGIKYVKDNTVWNTNFEAVYHFTAYSDYGYVDTRDSSFYRANIKDNTTYYSSVVYSDATTYTRTGATYGVAATWVNDGSYDTLESLQFEFRSSSAAGSNDARFRIYYSDGTDSYTSVVSNTTDNWIIYDISLDFNNNTILKIELETKGSLQAQAKNLYLNSKELPREKIYVNTTFELSSVLGAQTLLGAINDISDSNSISLYVDDTVVKFDKYSLIDTPVFPANYATAGSTSSTTYITYRDFTGLNCRIEGFTVDQRTNNSDPLRISATIATYFYEDGSSAMTTEQVDAGHTSFVTRTHDNPYIEKVVSRVLVELKVIGAATATAQNLVWKELYNDMEYTYNGPTLAASTIYNLILFYDGATLSFILDGVVTNTYTLVTTFSDTLGFSIGARGSINAIDLFTGTMYQMIISSEDFSLEELATYSSNIEETDFYSQYAGDRLEDSRNNYHGNYDSTNVSSIAGKVGKGLKTSVTSDSTKMYVTIDAGEFDSGAFTVSGWINTHNSNNTAQTFMEYDTWSIKRIIGGNLQFEIDSTVAINVATTGLNMQHDTWYFFVATYDPANTNISIQVNNGTVYNQSLSTSTINAAVAYNLVFGSAESMSFDDIRLFNGTLSSSDVSLLYANGVGSETFVKDSINDVIQSVNLVNIGSSNIDTSRIINRVIAYGNTISDNIITVYTANNLASQNELWVKDKIITDDSIINSEDLKRYAERELRVNSEIEQTASITALGKVNLKPGANITVNVPNCNLSGVFRVQDLTHRLDYEFLTDITLSKRIEDFRDIFVNTINLTDFEKPSGNINNMKYSYRVTFEEDPQIVSLSNTRITDGDASLISGATTGTVTSNIITTRDNVAQCEFRRFENFTTEDDVYQVTNNGGLSWETLDRDIGVIHTFTSSGNKIGFRITLNRDATTDPSPAYRAVTLLYK